MLLTLLAIRQQRPQARYVLWPRVDQKSCFKCIVSAGGCGHEEVVLIKASLLNDKDEPVVFLFLNKFILFL